MRGTVQNIRGKVSNYGGVVGNAYGEVFNESGACKNVGGSVQNIRGFVDNHGGTVLNTPNAPGAQEGKMTPLSAAHTPNAAATMSPYQVRRNLRNVGLRSRDLHY